MRCITRESKDGGYGIWRRLILIPFEVIIKEKDRGKKLPEKLRKDLNYIQELLLFFCNIAIYFLTLACPHGLIVRFRIKEYVIKSALNNSLIVS